MSYYYFTRLLYHYLPIFITHIEFFYSIILDALFLLQLRVINKYPEENVTLNVFSQSQGFPHLAQTHAPYECCRPSYTSSAGSPAETLFRSD
jgi:hypothetical protein